MPLCAAPDAGWGPAAARLRCSDVNMYDMVREPLQGAGTHTVHTVSPVAASALCLELHAD
jgi:hypothetical protein